jgi:hypothetical protein
VSMNSAYVYELFNVFPISLKKSGILRLGVWSEYDTAQAA